MPFALFCSLPHTSDTTRTPCSFYLPHLVSRSYSNPSKQIIRYIRPCVSQPASNSQTHQLAPPLSSSFFAPGLNLSDTPRCPSHLSAFYPPLSLSSRKCRSLRSTLSGMPRKHLKKKSIPETPVITEPVGQLPESEPAFETPDDSELTRILFQMSLEETVNKEVTPPESVKETYAARVGKYPPPPASGEPRGQKSRPLPTRKRTTPSREALPRTTHLVASL